MLSDALAVIAGSCTDVADAARVSTPAGVACATEQSMMIGVADGEGERV